MGHRPGTPAPGLTQEQGAAGSIDAALRLGRLRAERDALAATIPADPIGEIVELNAKLTRLSQDREDLKYGRGRYVGTAMGQATADLIEARSRRHSINGYLGDSRMGWRMRRSWQREEERWAQREHAAQERCYRLVAPEMARLETDIDGLSKELGVLFETKSERSRWRRTHPGVSRGIDRLDAEIAAVEDDLGLAPVVGIDQHLSHGPAVEIERPTPTVVRELDHGLGLGL